MRPKKQKGQPGLTFLACGRAGLRPIDIGGEPCHSQSATSDRTWEYPITAKILRKCKNMASATIFHHRKKMASPVTGRRSFHTARQSCVVNLSRPDTYSINYCEANPTYEGGTNSVNVTNCRNRQGADLPSVVNWLLMTGLVERLLYEGHEQPSLDRLWRK